MPIFICLSCGYKWVKRLILATTVLKCPKCGSKEIARLTYSGDIVQYVKKEGKG